MYERYEAVVKAAAEQAGGIKAVACVLRPGMEPDDAARWFNACCDVDKREKFSLGELAVIRRVARTAGVHLLTEWEAREAGYMRPVPAPLAEEVRSTIEDISSLLTMATDAIARLEKLKADGWPP